MIKKIFNELLDIYNNNKKHQLLNKEVSFSSKEKNNIEKNVKKKEIK